MTEPKIIECVQGTEPWFAARLGHLGSSCIGKVVKKRKRGDGELQPRANLRVDLAVERITKKPMEHYVSFWMDRGRELEPLARAGYEMRKNVQVRQVGLVLNLAIKWTECSPDGLIGTDGLVELKVPKNSTHFEYLKGECVPEEYVHQCMWQMAITGRQWVDFVSYAPDFPDPLDLFIYRLQRDERRIAEMEEEARKFLQEVESEVTRATVGLEGLLRESLVPKAIIPAWNEKESLADA